MVRISIKVKYPNLKLVIPFRLQDPLSTFSKSSKMSEINYIFSEIERWAKVERNYTT